MFLDPGALFMLAVLVAVTGYVARGLMASWHKLNRGEKSDSTSVSDMEERMRKVEAATSSLLVDVHSIREKQRFMARLQAGVPPREQAVTHPDARAEGELSPMHTQSMPVIPRAR
ncbi:MAG TPA: hypothetical protein VHM24_13995 [Gemmatimonadaceae bacterium]|nr:hypothetical protein [Gemmatimonadaceae bacterium]